MSAFKFGRKKNRVSGLSQWSLGRRAQRAAVVTRAAIESLEERRLLSGSPYLIGSGTHTNDLMTAVGRDASTGKVIVAGIQSATNTVELARFNADGTLDDGSAGDTSIGDSFGTGGGVVATSLGAARITAIAIDSVGHIVAAGVDGIGPIVVRFNSDGSLDNTFGAGGVAHVGDGSETVDSVAIGTGNVIAVGGSVGFSFGSRQFFVSALTSTGAPIFATTTSIGLDASVNSVTFVDGGASVVAGGESSVSDGDIGFITSFTVAKYIVDPSGTLDTAFDGDGVAITTLNTPSGPASSSIIRSLAVSGVNSIVAIGGSTGVIGLVQYDATTGTAVQLTQDNPDIQVMSGNVDSSGNIYVAGIVNVNVFSQLGSIRYAAPNFTAIDPGYGVAMSPLQVGDFATAQAIVSPDGTVVHATSTDVISGDSDLAAGTIAPSAAPGFASVVGFTLPAATLVTATVDGSGVLTITGTTGDDTIQVRLTASNGYRIDANAQAPIFITDPVTTIIVQAGDGNDTIVVASSVAVPTFISGEGGNDTITTNGQRSDTLNGGEGNDTLSAGGGSDQLFGGNGADLLNGNAGDDDLNGEAGNDTLNGGGGNDLLDGGADDDVLSGGAGNDEVHGGDGNDQITGDGGDDFLFGEAGNDTITGSGGMDVFVGGEGDDVLSGGAGRDVLIGGNGSDTITGDNGDDILVGGITSWDADVPHLTQIRDIWNNGGSYLSRVGQLSGTPSSLLGSSNVPGDGMSDFDNLSGNNGRDWFISDVGDILFAQNNEIVT